MSESHTEVIRRYIEDALAAEQGFEAQLTSYADEADDDQEVRSLFAQHARQTSSQVTRLHERFQALGGLPATAGKSRFAQLFTLAPKAMQSGHSKEERVAQNLMAAYAVEMSECAMYEALLTVARLAGHSATVALALEIAREERETALKIWHLIPSRSKIAFNMLTVGEIDPSVETRTAADRIL